jgi:hypothetical protein
VDLPVRAEEYVVIPEQDFPNPGEVLVPVYVSRKRRRRRQHAVVPCALRVIDYHVEYHLLAGAAREAVHRDVGGRETVGDRVEASDESSDPGLIGMECGRVAEALSWQFLPLRTLPRVHKKSTLHRSRVTLARNSE